MKGFVSLLVFLLALCCMAQAQVTGVTLSGPLLDAVVTNQLDQPVLAVNVGYTDAKGIVWRHQMHFTGDSLGLAPGASQSLHTWSKRQVFNAPGKPATLVSYVVTAVILTTGELRGDERGYATGLFMSNVQNTMEALTKLWVMAGKRDWAGIQSLADSGDEGSGAARRMLMARDKSGPDAAVKSFSHLGKLPQNIYQGRAGAALAKLKQIPGVMDLAAWFAPVAVHAQGPLGTAYTWPPTYYNPPYYPSQWIYYCNNPVFGGPGPNPCPTTYQSTPAQGVAANCLGGRYTIGIQIIIGDDDVGYPQFQNQSGTIANPYQLRSTGHCSDNATGVYTTWTYLNNCSNGNPAPPILYQDNTNQNMCGLSISGWYPY